MRLREPRTPKQQAEYDNPPFADWPSWTVIINAIHERGPRQANALAELNRRGLWLTAEQRQQAGLSDGQ